MINLFSLNGFAFFPSSLSAHSVLVKLQEEFYNIEQFDYAYLNDFLELNLGIDFIKYALYIKNKDNSVIKKGSFHEDINLEEETNIIWPILIEISNHPKLKHQTFEVQLKFTKKQIDKIEKCLLTTPKTLLNVDLIDARFKELIIYLQLHEFDSMLDKPQIIEQLIIDETCSFMVFEAVYIAQVNEIIATMEKNIKNENLLQKTKVEDRVYQGKSVNTINYFNVINNKKILYSETSKHRYLEASVVFFPLQKKSFTYIFNVIKNNINKIEKICLKKFRNQQ